jgi:hypothetical protein
LLEIVLRVFEYQFAGRLPGQSKPNGLTVILIFYRWYVVELIGLLDELDGFKSDGISFVQYVAFAVHVQASHCPPYNTTQSSSPASISAVRFAGWFVWSLPGSDWLLD